MVPLIVALSGCTRLKVEPAKRGEIADGLVYALPKPMLEVRPSSDGSMQAKFIFVADPDRQYAIRASSTLSKHNLTIDITNNVLRKLEWKPDATAVLSQAVAVAAEVAKSVEKVREAEEKAADEKRKSQKINCDQAAKEVQKAEDAVTTAEKSRQVVDDGLKAIEFQLARARVNNDTNKIALLEVEAFIKQQELRRNDSAVSDAKTKLGEAEEERDRICAKVPDYTPRMATGSSAQSTSTATNEKPSFPMVWGPILFDVQEGYRAKDANDLKRRHLEIRLTPVKLRGASQPQFPTALTIETNTPSKPPTISWSMKEFEFYSASNQESVVKTRLLMEDKERRAQAATGDAQKTARLDADAAAASYTTEFQRATNEPVRLLLSSSKPVKPLAEVKVVKVAQGQMGSDPVSGMLRQVITKEGSEHVVLLWSNVPMGMYALRFHYPVGEKLTEDSVFFLVK